MTREEKLKKFESYRKLALKAVWSVRSLNGGPMFDRQDAIQKALIFLWEAIDRWDGSGCKFSTFIFNSVKKMTWQTAKRSRAAANAIRAIDDYETVCVYEEEEKILEKLTTEDYVRELERLIDGYITSVVGMNEEQAKNLGVILREYYTSTVGRRQGKLHGRQTEIQRSDSALYNSRLRFERRYGERLRELWYRICGDN